MKTININGKDFTIEALNKLIEQSQQNPLDKVYEYNGTTRQEFDRLYEKIPAWVKATAQEELIANYYNKGKKLDWSKGNSQKKCEGLWDLSGGEPRLDHVGAYHSYAGCSSRLCYLRESDLREAVETFYDEVYKISRGKR